MKRMNKLLALLLAVIMVASFAACGNEPAPTPDPAPAAPPPPPALGGFRGSGALRPGGG